MKADENLKDESPDENGDNNFPNMGKDKGEKRLLCHSQVFLETVEYSFDGFN